MPEIVRDLGRVRDEHTELAARLATLDETSRRMLASHDDELTRFDDMCMRTRSLRLFSFGLLPGDEIRHPAAPGLAARLVPGNAMEIEGVAMTIDAATRHVATRAAKGCRIAIGDWTARGRRVGDGLHLNPAPITTDAQEEAATPQPSTNLSFAF